MPTVSRNVTWLETTTSMRACAASDATTGNIYVYVSSSATPPSATDLKAGTGAEASDSVAVSAAVRQFFTPLTVSAGTWYAHYLYNDGISDSAIVTEGPFRTAGPSTVITEKTTTVTARQYDFWMLEVFSASTWGVGSESKHRVTWNITGPNGWTWTETDRRTLSNTAGQTIDYRTNWVGRAISVPMTVAGTYTAIATITDAEGNTSTSSESTITVTASPNIYTIGSGGDYATLNAWATAKAAENDQEVRLTDATTYDITSNFDITADGVRFVNTSGGTATIRNNGSQMTLNSGGAAQERVVFHDLNYRGVLGNGTEQVIRFINSIDHIGCGIVGGQVENSLLHLMEATFGDDAWVALLGMAVTTAQMSAHYVGAFGGEGGGVITVSGPLATSSGERPYRSTFACHVLNDPYADTESDPGNTKSAIRLFKSARADVVRGYVTNTVEIGLDAAAYGERIRLEAIESQFSETGTDNTRMAVNIVDGDTLGLAFVDVTITAMVGITNDTSITQSSMRAENIAALSVLYNTMYRGTDSVQQGLFQQIGTVTLATGFESTLVGNIFGSADLSSSASTAFQNWLQTGGITGYTFQDNIWPDITYSRNDDPYNTISGASDTPAQYDAQTYTTNESHQIVTLDGVSPSVLKPVTLVGGAHVDFNGAPRLVGESGYAGASQEAAFLNPSAAPAGNTGSYAYADEKKIYLVYNENITYTGSAPHPITITNGSGASETVTSVTTSGNIVEITFTGDTPQVGDETWTVTLDNSLGYILTNSNDAPVASFTNLPVGVQVPRRASSIITLKLNSGQLSTSIPYIAHLPNVFG